MTNDGTPGELRLIRPVPEYLPSYYRVCQETWGRTHEPYIIHDPALFPMWKKTIFETYRQHERGEALPEGFVPSATFWAIEGKELVGVVNIRLRLNEFLRTRGGHIGFFVRQSYRGRGYAKRLIPLSIDAARQLGIQGDILIICMASNTPSYRALLASHYRRRDRIEAKFNGQLCQLCRFFF